MINNFQKELVLALHAQRQATKPTPKFAKNDLMHLVSEATQNVCQTIHQNPGLAKKYSSAANTIAFITDGSNLGYFQNTAFPVVEHQVLLLKTIAGVEGVPLVIKSSETARLEQIITSLSSNFGAINLVGLSASKAMQIETQLHSKIKTPVIWAAKDSACVIALSALKRAAILQKRNLCEVKTVIYGPQLLATIISQFLRTSGWTNLQVITAARTSTVEDHSQQPKFDNEIQTLINLTSETIISEKNLHNTNSPLVVLEFGNFNSLLVQENHNLLYASASFAQPNSLQPFLVTPAILKIALQNNKPISDEIKIRLATQLVSYTTQRYSKQLLPPLWDQNITPLLIQKAGHDA